MEGEPVVTFFVKLVIALLFHNHLFRVLDKGVIFFQALKSRLVGGVVYRFLPCFIGFLRCILLCPPICPPM